MRQRAALALLLGLGASAGIHAAGAAPDQQHFAATLHLGATPRLRYLDSDGRPLDYAAFAHQLAQGRGYSISADPRAGAAVLRLYPPGTHAGAPGRFAFGRGDAFPPFALHALRGGVVRLSDFRGRYTLVAFFFAECAPCIAEAPTLSAFARAHPDMGFVAITYENAATARGFAREHGLDGDVLYDGQSLIDTLGVGTYPTLILLDPSGRVAGAAVGTWLDESPARRLAQLRGWVAQWKQAMARMPPTGG